MKQHEWTATVDRAGRVTIPAELRKQSGLLPGVRVRYRAVDDHITVTLVRQRRPR